MREIDPADVGEAQRGWETLLERRYLVGSCVLLALIVAAFCNALRPVYQATAIVGIQEASQDPLTRVSGDPTRDKNLVSLNAAALASPGLAFELVKRLGPEARADLADGSLRTLADLIVGELRGRFGSRRQLSDAEAATVLQSRLIVSTRESSTWIEVNALAHDSAVAVQLADGIIDLYKQRNTEQNQRAADEAARAVAESLEERQKRLGEQLDGAKSVAKETGLREAEARRAALQQETQTLMQSLTQIQATRAAELAAARAVTSGGGLSQPQVAAAASRIQELEDQLAAKTATLGERHPEVVALTQQLQVAHTRASNARISAQSAAEARVDAAAREEARLQAKLNAARAELSTLAESPVAYSVSQQEAEATRAALNSLIFRRENGARTVIEMQTIQQAIPPTVPVYPQKGRNYAVALGAGLALGVALSWLLSSLDTSIRRPTDIQNIPGLRLLGVVPQHIQKGLSSASGLVQASNGFADGIRMVRTGLMFSLAEGRGPKVVVVTSASPEEGKSTVATSLAVLLTETSSRVLLVDADLRRPSCHLAFGAKNDTGLADFLAVGDVSAAAPDTRPVRGLRVITAGSPRANSSALLGSPAMAELLKIARENCDWIVIDSPPALVLPDASILANLADGVLFVSRADMTRKRDLMAAVDHVRGMRGNILGVVLNDVNMRRHSYYYGRTYSAYYGTARTNEKAAPAVSKASEV